MNKIGGVYRDGYVPFEMRMFGEHELLKNFAMICGREFRFGVSHASLRRMVYYARNAGISWRELDCVIRQQMRTNTMAKKPAPKPAMKPKGGKKGC